MENLGSFLRGLRDGRGKTMEEVGAALVPPVQRAAIHKWEACINPLKVDTLRQLLDLYDANTEQRIRAFELAIHAPLPRDEDASPDRSGPQQPVTADTHDSLDEPTEETTAPPASDVSA